MTSLLPTSSSTSTPHQVVPFTGSFGGPGHTDFMAEFGRVGSKGKKRKTIVTAEERERRNKMARENGWRNYTMANELILKEGTKKQKETLAKQEAKKLKEKNKKNRKSRKVLGTHGNTLNKKSKVLTQRQINQQKNYKNSARGIAAAAKRKRSGK